MKKTFDALAKLALSRSGDRAPRYDFKTSVALTLQGQRRFEGETVNISRTGVLIRFRRPQIPQLEVGQEVELLLQADRSILDEPLHCTAQVMRLVPSADPSYQDVGMRFTS